MRYYRCKCGKAESWGSMPPKKCQGCSECNTTLELHPDHHRTPDPHEFVTRYDETTGEPYQICKRCWAKPKEPPAPDNADWQAANRMMKQ